MFAYLDPGVGSMVLQAWVAGLLGGVFAVKTMWHRLKSKAAAKE